MASVSDVAILTWRLQQLAHEMYSEASRTTTNLSRLAELSDKVAEFADHVAVTLGELNESLERCPVLEEARSLSEAVAAPAGERAEPERVAVDEPAGGAATGGGASNARANGAEGSGGAAAGRMRALTALLPRAFAPPPRAASNGHAATEPSVR